MNISSEHIVVKELISSSNGVKEIEQFLFECEEQFNLSEELKFKFQVALSEAVTNAICHGNQNGKAKTVIITCVRFKHFIRLSIKDEGHGFDFHHNPDPTCEKNIEEPNGRGLFLIEKISDRVQVIDRGRIIQIDFRE